MPSIQQICYKLIPQMTDLTKNSFFFFFFFHNRSNYFFYPFIIPICPGSPYPLTTALGVVLLTYLMYFHFPLYVWVKLPVEQITSFFFLPFLLHLELSVECGHIDILNITSNIFLFSFIIFLYKKK